MYEFISIFLLAVVLDPSLAKPHRSKKTYLVYVLCYDDRSCNAANAFFGHNPWAKMVNLPQSVFFETYAFTRIFPERMLEDQWEKYDYVGTISWKAPYKFMESFRFGPLIVPNIVKLAPEGADVIALVGQLGSRNIVQNASLAHPRFKEVWEGLLGAFNKYTPEEISTEGMTPFYCNYWLARPQHAIKFIDFMKKAHHLMETLPSIQEPLWADAQYVNNTAIARGVFGRDYYTHHPFVLERLTPFFFNVEKLNIHVFKQFRTVWNLKPVDVSVPSDRRVIDATKKNRNAPDAPKAGLFAERYDRYKEIVLSS